MNIFSAGGTGDWRAWLARNWQSEKEVWLVIPHSGSGTPGPRYHEAKATGKWQAAPAVTLPA